MKKSDRAVPDRPPILPLAVMASVLLKMFKVGLPEPVIRQKMAVIGYSLSDVETFFTGAKRKPMLGIA